jgi:hypothetical protein
VAETKTLREESGDARNKSLKGASRKWIAKVDGK